MKQPTPVFEGHVVDGKMKMLDHVRAGLKRWMATFKEGTKVDVVIRKHRKKRTNLQNSYYWGVVLLILSNEFGYETEEMHMVLREKFLRIHDDKHPDFVIAKSTTKLSTIEFSEYIDKIQRWAAVEHQTYIPDPESMES